MVEIRTSAKLNFGLEVISRRDDGYHNISSVLQSVNLFDDISLNFASRTAFSSNVPYLNNEFNLIMIALKIFEKHTKVPIALDIFLEKRIPVGMGLGGGSGNAAGVLYALNKMYSTGLSVVELKSIGASIGADVPYFFEGGTAVVKGMGDEVTSLPHLSLDNIWLVCPRIDYPNKTASFFQQITSKDFSNGSQIDFLCEQIKSNKQIIPDFPQNVFSKILTQKFPQIQDLKNQIETVLGTKMYVTGTGLGMFVITEESKALNELVDPEYHTLYRLKTTNTSIIMKDSE